jgi:hypothetical protein
MQHRHLLPQELDLLVDGDVGFGVTPLRAHVESCDECRERLDALRAVAIQLDALPHFTPRLNFADRVMHEVQVIEPWHVALTASARRLVPQSTGMRVLAAAGAGLAATTISGSALWLAFRADLLGWSSGAAIGTAGAGAWAGLQSFASELISTRTDLGVMALGAAVLTVSSVGAVLAFRGLAAVARANRG